MSLEVPDFLKDDILFGELSEKIHFAINFYAPVFYDYPIFKNASLDEIKTVFIGYVCYQYLLIDDDITQHIFLRMLNSSEPKLRLYPLIEEFISVCLLSTKTDSNIKSDINEYKREYLKALSNIISSEYNELSKKNDEKYKKIIEDNYNSYDTDMDSGFLLTLTKCVIIESSKTKENYFSDIDDAIMYALELYYKQSITFEERKNVVVDQRRVLDIIRTILEENELTR
ncbi:MAG: hypothetical protein IKX00_05180 [Bacilli bacterium]|nr:hypothetical protein [Bacilli bacterium]